MVRFVVVDDHALFRRGIVESLVVDKQFSVVGEGGSLDDAVRLTRELNPDICVLDVNMPGGGIEAATEIRRIAPNVLILVFSFRVDPTIVSRAFDAGAQGYLCKGVSGKILHDAVRTVLGGGGTGTGPGTKGGAAMRAVAK